LKSDIRQVNAVSCIALLIAFCSAGGSLSSDELPVPRFERAEIPESMAPVAGEIDFGYLVVYENRRESSNSRTIRLPVMIGKSRRSEPRPDPILFTVGGPGVMTTLYAGRDLTQWPYLDERDFIYFEQRGALHAQPSLVGPEIDSVLSDAIGKNASRRPEPGVLLGAVARLKARLESEGIDLTAYNTTESAADIEDLRRVLGIERWNLYGISYSCLLMLEVMRNHPEGVRAAILDSPLIPGARWDETSVGNYWMVLHDIFEECRNDSVVNTAYPDLEKRFLDLLDEADRDPIAVSVEHPITKENVTVELDGEELFAGVALFIGNGQYIYGFPYWMDLMCKRDPGILSRMVGELCSIPSYAWGMRYSIWCNDVFPFEDFSKFGKHEGVPDRLSTISMTVVLPGIYDIWPKREAGHRFTRPVSSEIPVLVTNGRYDPDTPMAWGKELCRALPNSHYFLFPGQSHLPLFQHSKGRRIGMEFLDNPYERPDDGGVTEKPFRFYPGK
jgi:pimeloyl-ACP methyl ester carboxylesterase